MSAENHPNPTSETAAIVEAPCLSGDALAQVLPTEQNVGYQMRRIVTLVGAEIERRMEPLGLTDAQWKPLLRLFYSSDATVAALARGCHLDAGAMTRLLDRLESKNLCRRSRSLEDRRVVNLELTDEGRAAARQIPAIVDGVQQVVRQGFTAEEFVVLRGFIGRMLVNVQPFGDADAAATAAPVSAPTSVSVPASEESPT